MNFRSYSKLNNILGWVVFAVAAFTYLATMERNVSLWDTGEFISCADKLEVPHPPGAPMFILIYRLFAMLAPDPSWVPLMTNAASALSSAFTILFLFWSITALALKLLVRDEENIDQGSLIAILGSAAVGALAYTFSDTFWFSAVESEVYALSSMFTALVFWLALKWERRANERGQLRWLVLIFYLVGMVIGIHLLGLLVIPVVILMYYFKKYENPTWKGGLIAVGIGFVALGVVQYGMIQGLPWLASKVELMFVNSFGLPFWSGILFFFLLLIAALGYFIVRTHNEGRVMWNTVLLCFAAVLMGYTAYAQTVIRSYANPPIDMNDPEDVFSLIGYLSREQYGDNYLIKGPYYTAYNIQGAVRAEPGAMNYRKGEDEYIEAGRKRKLEFADAYTTVFPRMFNGGQENYINGYKYWGNIQNENKISFVRNNLRFFFQYQMRYMYWRYFAWNFLGRQNDLQGVMDEFNQGNWLTGISFIDEKFAGVGPQEDLPYYLRENKARNTLFGLPFLLGILGLIYQYRRNKKDFVVVFLFFFMTGLAIALYLNMPSPQPRERDYAFVGSFYVYAIWIGLGVLFLYDFFRKKIAPNIAAIASTGLCLVAVPVLMASQEWDDHDRSNRTASLDYGLNYLNSCAPNAVLFTNGDNDTYPLWYAQEVEGIRDDIRIINLSLFGTDWYINQMRRPINNAPGLKFSLQPDDLYGWDYLTYQGTIAGANDQYLDLSRVINFIASDDPRTKTTMYSAEPMPYLPAKKFRIPVDKQKVLANGTVRPEDSANIVDYIDFEISKNNLLKSEIMVLDFIATNNFELPVYFSVTSGPDEYLNLGSYLQQEGLTFRLTPVKRPARGRGDIAVAPDIMYENVMEKFKWGKIDECGAFVDYVLGRQAENMRSIFHKLASEMLARGENEKAIAVVDKCVQVIPECNIPYNFFMVPLAEVYFRAGAEKKGQELADRMYFLLDEELSYYTKLESEDRMMVQTEIQRGVYGLQVIGQMAQENGLEELAKKTNEKVTYYSQAFMLQQQMQ